jgi:hypothetical protein
MNRFLLLALALSLPLAARADDASRLAKAEQMIALAHVDRLTNQVMDTLLQQTTNIMTQQSGGSLTPEQKAALDEFQKKLVAAIEPQIGWKAVAPALAEIYAKTFTEDQMDAIISFYQSPAGAALMDKMPEINKQANEVMQARIIALQPQVRQMFADFQKSQQTPAPPASSSTAPAPATAPAPTSSTRLAPTLGPATPK